MADSADFRLRLITRREADFDQLATVINAAFAIYPFMDGPRTSPEGVEEELGDSGQFVVADGTHGLAGCAMIRPCNDIDWGTEIETANPVHDADAMYLGLVGVDPPLRKHGLGRRLIAEAERIARDRGFASMALGTLAEMGNVVYYEALGYRAVGHRRWEPGHWGLTIPHEFYVMAKPL